MLLYNSAFAPNPRRVRIFLAEKGVAIETRDIDLAALEHKGEAYKIVNPLCTLPALALDDGSVLTESVAICRYIERWRPAPPLMGDGAYDEAVVEMWQRRVEFGLFMPVGLAFRHSHPAMAAMERPQIAELAQVQRGRAAAFMRFLDGALAARRFVAGDAYTIADITALAAMDFSKFGRVEIPPDLPHLARWRAEVSARPSAAA
jgi:glutathione S-transferase